MKKIMLIALLFSATIITAQTVTPKLSVGKGQLLEQNSEVKVNMTQEMMGQSMNFNIETTTQSHFDIKDASSSSFSIAQTIKRVAMNMSGAGQEQKFDSDKKEDMDGQMGTAYKDLIGKPKEFTVNNKGIITAVKDTAGKVEQAMGMMGIMSGSMNDVGITAGKLFGAVANIPAKGAKVGDSWIDSTNDTKHKSLMTYTLKSISGNHGIVSVTGNTDVDQEVEQGSMAMLVKLKGISEGEYSFDLSSGIISSLKSTTKATGTVEVMGQSVPLKIETTTLTTTSKK